MVGMPASGFALLKRIVLVGPFHCERLRLLVIRIDCL